MGKTPEQVIAVLQRRARRAAEHIVILLDKNAGQKKEIRELEDTLAWVHRKLAAGDARLDILEVIEKWIPRRLARGDAPPEPLDLRIVEDAPVTHIFSGWTGRVRAIDEDGFVTVDPVYAGGKQWAAITVHADELRRTT